MKPQSAMMFLAVVLTSTASLAQGKLDRLGDTAPSCHLLMTEKECADFSNTLALLPPGKELEAFLTAHAETIREREKACACNQPESAARYFQGRRQAMLRY